MPTRLPMNETEIRSLSRSYSRSMLAVLVGVARQKTAQPGARVAAANSVLDRGWGKADQMHTVDGDIKVTIRHILERIDDKPVIIEGTEVRCIDATTTRCGCDACRDFEHASSCAVHNGPALPTGLCDCQVVKDDDSNLG